jgi:GT2 family glycosyltransferase
VGSTPTSDDPTPDTAAPAVGAVAIGRNEGERLERCLDALVGAGLRVVYVDSGSTDGSVAAARARGVEVVELDTSIKFTAARARNAGFARLLERFGEVELVQFVDGDCELEDGWIDTAVAALERDPALAVVCGRRAERHPEHTVYNLLCDLEWDTPIGPAEACGGDALYRRDAFAAVGGFDETLIAGEEPELCFRLRRAGRAVERLDAPMTRHDADMHRLGQWWQRHVRSGYAATEAWFRHGSSGETHMVRIAKSALFYAGALPAGAFAASLLGAWLAEFPAPLGWVAALAPWLLALALIARLPGRIAAHRRERGASAEASAVYGRYTTLAKLPELQGVLRYLRLRALGRSSALIEYK